ncbi:SCO family protein [Cohnella kolymensis]|uniref:SCO family protein n=1 Tax=Cohnella kolymensis TaxID=1590652 RepID=UPI000696B174|nr:SCO family protein [Cohnella kolymensis]
MEQSGDEQMQPKKHNLQRYAFPLIVLALCAGMGAYLLLSQMKKPELPVLAQGTEFSYADMNGETVTLSGTNGKVRLLYFFFANCPDVCPPTTFLMSQVQEELKQDGLFGDKVQFLSVTIDPDHDTPAVLKEYAQRFHADRQGWKFLWGDEKATAELARKYLTDVGKDKDGNYWHMNLIILLDEDGQIRDLISAQNYIEPGPKQLKPSAMADKIKSLL